MRNVLLYGAAALASLSGPTSSASAQSNASTLPPSMSEGVATAPLPVQGANNSNNRSVSAQPNGIANPAPGSVVIHFNGRVEYGLVAASSSFDTFRTSASLPPAKIDPFSSQGFARIYTGVDGLATNGLRYGASIEIRQDFGPAAGSTVHSAALGGRKEIGVGTWAPSALT